MTDDLPKRAMQQAAELLDQLRIPVASNDTVNRLRIHDLAAALVTARIDGHRDTQPSFEALGTALRMIRDAIEELAPVGAVPSRDVGPPNPQQDAEDVIAGIQATILAARREALEEAAQVASRIRPCPFDKGQPNPGLEPEDPCLICGDLGIFDLNRPSQCRSAANEIRALIIDKELQR